MDTKTKKELLTATLFQAPDELVAITKQFKEAIMMYNCAAREVTTKLEVLNEEFTAKGIESPIESIKSRIKTPKSIFDKLKRKGLPLTVESITKNLNDVAGVRIICSFVEDIYSIAEMLVAQDDIKLILYKDYIKRPKENGYRSLHLVVEVPVFFSDQKKPMRVEIQIRTIAMDFWASLEHQIHYKKVDGDSDMVQELKECADVIFDTDVRMQTIKNKMAQKHKQAAS